MELLPIEITEIISSFLPSIDDVVHLKSTCTYLNTNLSLHLGPGESDLELYLRIYNPQIEYQELACNSFSSRFIARNMDKHWNDYDLSRYKKLTDDIVRDNPNFPWMYNLVWQNSNISLDYAYEVFQRHGGKHKFFHPAITTDFLLSIAGSLLDWRKLTSHIDVDYILSHPELPWKLFAGLPKNPSLTVNHIIANPHINLNYSFIVNREIVVHLINTDPNRVISNRMFISSAYTHRPNLILTLPRTKNNPIKINKLALMNEQFFLQHIDNDIWNFSIISEQINSGNFHIVLGNLDKNWDWRLISYKVSWNIIVDNPDCPWIPDIVSANRHITLQIVKENPQYPWSFKGLSFNPNLTFDYVREHREDFLPYMKYVSINPGISLFAINKHPGYGWKWVYVSLRPYITTIDTLKYKRIKWAMKYVCIDMKMMRYRMLIHKELLCISHTK